MAPTSSFRPDAWQIDSEGIRTGNCIAQERLKSSLNNEENTSIQCACKVHWILDPLRWRLSLHGVRDPSNRAILIADKVNILKAKLGLSI